MSTFNGFLFSKLGRIGTKSEGPDYFLQLKDYSEVPIIKKAELWQPDPELQKCLGKKVEIVAKHDPTYLEYESVKAKEHNSLVK